MRNLTVTQLPFITDTKIGFLRIWSSCTRNWQTSYHDIAYFI